MSTDAPPPPSPRLLSSPRPHLPLRLPAALTQVRSEQVEALQHNIRGKCTAPQPCRMPRDSHRPADSIDLPAANMANLEEIRDVIVSVEPDQKLQLAQALLRVRGSHSVESPALNAARHT